MKQQNSHWVKKWWRGLKYDPGDPNYYEPVEIAAIGGGTGLSNLLSGIKQISHRLTAIVTVMDNGRSSGRIREGLKMLPPGDIRKCLAALSRNNGMLKNIFEYRFDEDCGELSGHAFGNIWLAALTDYFGSFEKAIEESSNLLDTVGKVYPSTLDKADLVCKFKDGDRVVGENKIAEANKPITKISLSKPAEAYGKTIKALEEAELIIIGPGSLYTSIIPNFLVKGINEAIAGNKKAVKIFICNVSTERGETENLTAEDHLRILTDYLTFPIDVMLVNNKILKKTEDSHKIGEINNISSDKTEMSATHVIALDLIDDSNPLYHDNKKLAKAVIDSYHQYHKN
jgi:uncharacterized cofD-like protein